MTLNIGPNKGNLSRHDDEDTRLVATDTLQLLRLHITAPLLLTSSVSETNR